MASLGTCTVHVEHSLDHSHHFSVGTQDMVDIITSAMAESGLVRDCNGYKVMAATAQGECRARTRVLRLITLGGSRALMLFVSEMGRDLGNGNGRALE